MASKTLRNTQSLDNLAEPAASVPSPTLSLPPAYPPLPRAPGWTRFAIPTKSASLSSGFPYDDQLQELKISHDQWTQFSGEIVAASKLTLKEDIAAWTTGITTGTVSSGLLLVFGPAVGYWLGRKVHRAAIEKKVQKNLTGDGDLRSIFLKWNETEFIARGFQAWLDLPNKEWSRFRLQIVPCEPATPAVEVLGPPLVRPTTGVQVNGVQTARGRSEISRRSLPPSAVQSPSVVSPIVHSPNGQSPNGESSNGQSSTGESSTAHQSRYTDTKIGEIKHELPAERDVAELE
ncbi:uncharacterized protein BP5553_00257 [Venustampulla echinocandica]|uniref:Uncharacterized protein n=1 Tax=Venustampulla echinocandica TaxID=2656787 RepID=A0A370TXP7_9HELO|nr:uncharacterized protein BP5553_00257 [Venustampulla echinocandica]RDL40278.1 hypothetical protein BP5553_00257 [Venustampulla echinocandica]